MDGVSFLTGLIIGLFLGIILGLYIWRSLISERFGNLASTALKSKNDEFLDLANQKLAPIEQKLEEYKSMVIDIEKQRIGAYSSLETKINELKTSQSELQKITTTLSTALRNPQVRGRWGEITLKRLVELAGMADHCDFDTQVTASNDAGRIRPDMVVNLPDGKKIIVDSKVPLQSYIDSFETNNESERKNLIDKHAQAIRDHIKSLSSKTYWQQFEDTPEFVVMFIPGEAFLYVALEEDKDLIEYGMKLNVIVATPTTLISLLKAVNRGWSEKKMEENARKISQLGRELYERLSNMNEGISDVGKKIEKSVDSYNKLVATFDGRVLVSARRFGELGVGNATILETPKQLEKTVREVSYGEKGVSINGEERDRA